MNCPLQMSIHRMASCMQHVLAFSPEGKFLALIDDQGILRIWDTDTNELRQEFTPNLHLSGPCTALAWVVATTSKHKSKKLRKSTEYIKDALYIALGTSSGQVSLYSYAQAQIERNLNGEGHTSKITCMVYNDGTLYTCGEDCNVIDWSLPAEKQLAAWSVGPEKPHSVAYMSQSNSLVVGSRQIKVYSVATHELLQTFTGHTSEVNLMNSFITEDNREYAVTTSRMERIICLWKIGKKGRNKPTTCTLLMEDIAHCLSCKVLDDGNLQVLSVTRSGVIHVYLISIERAEKPIKPKVTIGIASDDTNVTIPIPAVAATVQHSGNAQNILFGYGEKRFLVFEQLAPNYTERMQALVRTDPKKLQDVSSKKNTVGTNVALKTMTPIVNVDDVDYKSSTTMAKKRVKPIEIPMEARLQNLNLSTDGNSTLPQAQSKVQLLVQALHSKDSVLLRSVLCTNDLKTIQLTLERLPVQYVGTLVNELTVLMQQKRMNVGFSINWLKSLAQSHSSQLMALGKEDLLNKFGPCIGIIEHHASCLKEMSKLSGRLQLLVSQIKRNAEKDQLRTDNCLVYQDGDSSNSELEESGEKSASDGEWEEDVDDSDESMQQDD